MVSIEIREEIEADEAEIRAVTEVAFRGKPYAGGDEQDVIERLRMNEVLTLSLVATENHKVVGQITFSPAVTEDGSGPWFALGPVSVTPSRQSKGVGAALVNEGLSKIEKMGALGCILTGNPVYYRRFGFMLSPGNTPSNEPEEYFQIKLINGQLPMGRFAFHGAFYEDP